MKKSFTLLLAFCGLVAILIVHGIAAADGPISPVGFVPRADNTYYLPNTGGGAGPEWGPYVGVDGHGDASPYRNPAHYEVGPLYGGLVLTWTGPLPTGLAFNQPFLFNAPAPYAYLNPPVTVPSTLDGLLTQYGSQINDMVWFDGGISSVNVISEPVKSLLPFETADPNVCVVGDCKKGLWDGMSSMYQTYPVVVIPADISQVYTKYIAQNLTWPGWDPFVQDAAYYAGREVYCDRSDVCTSQPRWNSDYPDPSTWTQYNFYIQNDIPTVPEPGALLLLGFGLMAVVGMRRVVKAKA